MNKGFQLQFSGSPSSSALTIIGDNPKARGLEDDFFHIEENASRAYTEDDDYPEGGLKAWLVVFGVSVDTDGL